MNCINKVYNKNAPYLTVNVFSTKVLIEDTVFYVSCRRQDRHFTWSSEPHEGLTFCKAKGVLSFLSYFKILSIGPAPGIEPATSRAAFTRSTDWANPASVISCIRSLLDASKIKIKVYLSIYPPKEKNFLNTLRHTFFEVSHIFNFDSVFCILIEVVVLICAKKLMISPKKWSLP